MNQLLRVLYISRKDVESYYSKPPLITWGLLFPAVLILAMYVKDPQTYLDVAPGIIAMTLLFGNTSMAAIVVTFEKRCGTFPQRRCLRPGYLAGPYAGLDAPAGHADSQSVCFWRRFASGNGSILTARADRLGNGQGGIRGDDIDELLSLPDPFHQRGLHAGGGHARLGQADSLRIAPYIRSGVVAVRCFWAMLLSIAVDTGAGVISVPCRLLADSWTGVSAGCQTLTSSKYDLPLDLGCAVRTGCPFRRLADRADVPLPRRRLQRQGAAALLNRSRGVLRRRHRLRTEPLMAWELIIDSRCGAWRMRSPGAFQIPGAAFPHPALA